MILSLVSFETLPHSFFRSLSHNRQNISSTELSLFLSRSSNTSIKFIFNMWRYWHVAPTKLLVVSPECNLVMNQMIRFFPKINEFTFRNVRIFEIIRICNAPDKSLKKTFLQNEENKPFFSWSNTLLYIIFPRSARGFVSSSSRWYVGSV